MAEKKNRYKSSFGVLRANPRISGNLKVTVDSRENLWLNSIDSNDEMSKNQYKGFRVSNNYNFAQDVYQFFDNGKTPSNFIFGIRNEDRVRETETKSLTDQYDGFYHMGVTPLISSLYSESFSYLAPMWLGEQIPKYFVIFRTDDPIDYSYQVPVTSLEMGKVYKVIGEQDVEMITGKGVDSTQFKIISNRITYTSGSIFTATATTFNIVRGSGKVIILDDAYNKQYIQDVRTHLIDKILPKSSIVKTFSLKDDSNIGKYLRKIKQNSLYSQGLIDVKFEERSLSLYNGVSVKNGVYSNKGEFLNSIFTRDSNIIEFEEYITDGFRRNDVISYNLLNLEFLFDDQEADLYSINRYFGLYVDDIPTGEFQLSGRSFYSKSAHSGNFPEPKNANQISDKMLTSFYQKNDNGLRIFLNPDSKWGFIPSSDDIHLESKERLKMFYVKDKKDEFYSYKQYNDYSTSVISDENKWGIGTTQENLIILKNKTLDLSIFSGIEKKKTKEYKAELTNTKGHSYSVIKINKQLSPNDAIVLYHPFGVNLDGNRRYDYFVASDLTYVLGGWGPESYTETGGSYYFHPFGTESQIAKAIANVLNSVNYKTYKAFNIGNEVIIRTEGADARIDSLLSLFFYSDFYQKSPYILSDTLYVNDIDVKDLTSDYNFIGGCKYTNTRIKIKTEDALKIKKGLSYIRTNAGLSKVKFIGKCIDPTTIEIESQTIKNYDSHSIIEIEDHSHLISLGSSKTIITEELVTVQTGIFSMYGLKDLDIDFWSSTYGRTPTDEYYRYLDVKPNTKGQIYPGISYAVATGSIVGYNGAYYGNYQNSQGYVFVGSSLYSDYTLFQSSDVSRQNVVPLLYVKNPDDAFNGINDPLTDLDKFPGFSGLQDIKFLEDTRGIFSKNDQLLFGKANNEYDVLKENYQRDLVLKSRVTPYISKWVFEGGTDVRGNGYRLNSSHTFTPLNFSPSFFSNGRDPLYFTNEWYLLSKPPITATEDLLKTSSNYCAGNDVDDIDSIKLKNADPADRDYFLDFFSVDGSDLYYTSANSLNFNGIKNKPIEERYTYFNYDSASGFSETIFRGIKVRIKERTDASLTTKEKDKFKSGDKKFNDYKFSCVLKSIEDPNPYGITSPVTFEVIQNDTFKTVTILVTIINNDSRFIDPDKFLNTLSFSGVYDPATSTDSWYFNPSGIYGSVDYFGLYSISDKRRHSVYFSQGGTPTNEYVDLNTFGNYLTSSIADVKLSCGLNPSSKPTIGLVAKVDRTTDGIIPILENPDYDVDLREEVKFYSPTTTTAEALAITGGTYTFYAPKVNNTSSNPLLHLPWPTGVGKNYLNFNKIVYQGLNSDYHFDFTGLGYPPPTYATVPVSGLRPIDINNTAIYQIGTGANYWDYIFNIISFPEIYKLFSSDSPFIKYTKSYWDTTLQQTKNVSNTFVLEFIKPSSFLQKARKIPLEEDFKPDTFSSTVVGYKLTEEKNITEYFRYGGNYSPKFRDVLFFSNVKNDILKVDRDNNGIAAFLTVHVSLREKIKGESLYYGIGSNYEILIDGIPRKKLKLIRGNTYQFIFDNFNSISFPTSPVLYNISKNFRLSFSENSGKTSDLYLKGTQDIAGGIYVEIPMNAPDVLYYELEGEDFAGGQAIISEGFEYKNTTLGIDKDGFGTVKNINYYKYAKTNPFRIDSQSGYKLKYPLIGETPIDRRDFSIFESTWDPARYREYTSSLTYKELPGVKNMTEYKSFFGSKAMRTPNTIKECYQTKYESSIDDVFNVRIDLYPDYEILWEETETEIKALLLLDRTAIKHFKYGGVANTFNNLLVSEFGVGSETTLDDDVQDYISSNILPQYETKEITVYVKKISTLTTKGINLEPIITNLSDYQKISSDFIKAVNNDISRRGTLEFEYTLHKDPGYDYSVAFSFIIGKI